MSDKLPVVDFQVTSFGSNDKLKSVGHQRIGNLWVAGAWKPASEGESAGGFPNYKDEAKRKPVAKGESAAGFLS